MSPPSPSCETKKAFEAAAAAPPPSGCGSSAPAPSSDAVTDAVACAPKIKVKVKKSGGSAVPGGGGLLFPSGYGFVVLTAVGSIMMVTWKSLKVGLPEMSSRFRTLRCTHPTMWLSTVFSERIKIRWKTIPNSCWCWWSEGWKCLTSAPWVDGFGSLEELCMLKDTTPETLTNELEGICPWLEWLCSLLQLQNSLLNIFAADHPTIHTIWPF